MVCVGTVLMQGPIPAPPCEQFPGVLTCRAVPEARAAEGEEDGLGCLPVGLSTELAGHQTGEQGHKALCSQPQVAA